MTLNMALEAVLFSVVSLLFWTVNPLLRLRVGKPYTNLTNKLRNRAQIVAN